MIRVRSTASRGISPKRASFSALRRRIVYAICFGIFLVLSQLIVGYAVWKSDENNNFEIQDAHWKQENSTAWAKFNADVEASRNASVPLGTLGFTVAPGGGGIEDHLTREPLIPPIVLTRTSGPNLSGTNLALGPFVKLTKITALQAHFLLQSSSHSKVTFSLSYPGGEVQLETFEIQPTGFQTFSFSKVLGDLVEHIILGPGQKAYLNVISGSSSLSIDSDSSSWITMWESPISSPVQPVSSVEPRPPPADFGTFFIKASNSTVPIIFEIPAAIILGTLGSWTADFLKRRGAKRRT